MDTLHIIQDTGSNATAHEQRTYKRIYDLQCNRAAKKISKNRTICRKKARRSKLAFTQADTTTDLWSYNFTSDSESEEPSHLLSNTDTDNELCSDSDDELPCSKVNSTIEFPSTSSPTSQELTPASSSPSPRNTSTESQLLSNAIETGDLNKLSLVLQKTELTAKRFWFMYEEEIFRSLQLCQNNVMFDILRDLGAFKVWTNQTWYKYLQGGYEGTFQMAIYFYNRPYYHDCRCGCLDILMNFWEDRGREFILLIIRRCGSSFARRLMKERNIQITVHDFLYCVDEEEALCWSSVLDLERLKDPTFYDMSARHKRYEKYNWIGFHVLCSHEGFTKEVENLEDTYRFLLSIVSNHAEPTCECLRLHWMSNALQGIFMPFGASLCLKNPFALLNPKLNWDKLVTHFLTVECGFENGICVDVDGIIREFVGCGFLMCVDEDMRWGEFLSMFQWHAYSGEFSRKFLSKSAREMICLVCENHGFETMGLCCV